VARQAFTICGQFFKTKTALETEAKHIRDSQPISIPLNSTDTAFIEELFRQLYPKSNYDEKQLGVGARSITVVSILGGRCFQFHLKNGRVEEPSLRLCFQKSLADPSATAKGAFRYEVFSDCMKYRDAYFEKHSDESSKAPCELTGKLITVKECEVDHIPPDTFQVILEDYLKDTGLTLAGVATKDPPDGFGAVLADRDLAQDWKSYHLSRARFRVLDHFAHVEETQKQFEEGRASTPVEFSEPPPESRAEDLSVEDILEASGLSFS
jgi:hypothetical protein